MFEPNKITREVRGQSVTLRELTGEEFTSIEEDADMATIIALSWDPANVVTAQQVRSWPFSVQKDLYDICVELNGLNQGN
jgi:hypothetical protein